MENLTQLEQLWSTLLGNVEVKLSRAAYETLASTARPKELRDGVLTLAVQSNFHRNFILERCQVLVEGALHDLLSDSNLRIQIEVDPLPETEPLPALPQEKSSPQTVRQHRGLFLNPRYTFKNFVVGQGNRFAHAGCSAVAESPGHSYNPLFLYGGVGLGKTHLMQAIAHDVLQRNPETRAAYVTSEKFTNELINSIRDDKTEEFRRLYRNIDLLMVDDIQFLAGKERTQEEFFHTFNTLYEANRQIVISSDRPPRDIPTLEERLRSRFECGLIADIQPPDFETRIAILKKKAELAEVTVPDEVLTLIAERIHANIRELEGALIRLIAYASLNECDIRIEVAESVLRDILGTAGERKGLSIDLIKKMTAEYYSIKIDDMDAKIRTKEIATARQVAMYLARTLTSASLPKIGDEFGGRDHTTVIHAFEKIKSSVKNELEVRDAVEAISTNLKKYA